jgi:hypothetical protein
LREVRKDNICKFIFTFTNKRMNDSHKEQPIRINSFVFVI